ncbi:hypothetical protein Tco_1399178, partial [Tanacetum coccineum]
WRNIGRQQNKFRDNEKSNEGRPEQMKPNVGQFGSRVEYKRKQGERMESNKENNVGSNNETRKKWSLQKREYEALKKTTNKYSVLETLPDDDQVEINIMKDRMIEKWEEDRKKENEKNDQCATEDGSVEDDVLDDENEINENVTANEVKGRGGNILN